MHSEGLDALREGAIVVVAVVAVVVCCAVVYREEAFEFAQTEKSDLSSKFEVESSTVGLVPRATDSEAQFGFVLH